MSRTAILTIVALVFGLNTLADGQVISLGPGGLKVTPGQPQVQTSPIPGTSPVPTPFPRFPMPGQTRPPVTTLPYPNPQPQPPVTPLPYPNPQPQPIRPYPIIQPQPYPTGTYIPPSHGQYPIHVTPNEVIGVNPHTGGLDTQNRQIDNTVLQIGRNESQNNGTKRFVRRPIYNSQGQQVGYQEGWVWRNSITGQEHGELRNYTPNNKGGVNNQYQSKSVNPGVHTNKQSYSPVPMPNGQPQRSGVHKNVQSFGYQPTPAPKNPGGVHKNVQSFGVGK